MKLLTNLENGTNKSLIDEDSEQEFKSIFKKPRPRDIIRGLKSQKRKKKKKVICETEVDENNDNFDSLNMINVLLKNKPDVDGPSIQYNSFIDNLKEAEAINYIKNSTSNIIKNKSRPSSVLKYNLNSISTYNQTGNKSFNITKGKDVSKQSKNNIYLTKHHQSLLSDTNSFQNDSKYEKTTLNTPISITNAFKVRTQPRLYRSIKTTKEVPNRCLTHKNTPIKNKGSIGFISKSFKDYLKANNIPIVRNRDGISSGLVSPCRHLQSHLMTENSLFNTSISNVEEISKIQKNMICSSIPNFNNNSSAVLHRITMKHLNNEMDNSYKQAISSSQI